MFSLNTSTNTSSIAFDTTLHELSIDTAGEELAKALHDGLSPFFTEEQLPKERDGFALLKAAKDHIHALTTQEHREIRRRLEHIQTCMAAPPYNKGNAFDAIRAELTSVIDDYARLGINRLRPDLFHLVAAYVPEESLAKAFLLNKKFAKGLEHRLLARKIGITLPSIDNTKAFILAFSDFLDEIQKLNPPQQAHPFSALISRIEWSGRDCAMYFNVDGTYLENLDMVTSSKSIGDFHPKFGEFLTHRFHEMLEIMDKANSDDLRQILEASDHMLHHLITTKKLNDIRSVLELAEKLPQGQREKIDFTWLRLLNGLNKSQQNDVLSITLDVAKGSFHGKKQSHFKDFCIHLRSLLNMSDIHQSFNCALKATNRMTPMHQNVCLLLLASGIPEIATKDLPGIIDTAQEELKMATLETRGSFTKKLIEKCAQDALEYTPEALAVIFKAIKNLPKEDAENLIENLSISISIKQGRLPPEVLHELLDIIKEKPHSFKTWSKFIFKQLKLESSPDVLFNALKKTREIIRRMPAHLQPEALSLWELVPKKNAWKKTLNGP